MSRARQGAQAPVGTAAADRYVYERQARSEGFRAVVGVDEVGRGTLAGPVVAAAVRLPAGGISLPLDDSKALRPRQREALAAALLRTPGVYAAIGAVSAARIDEINILRATVEAMQQALDCLGGLADYALVDGLPLRGLPVPAAFIVHGDARSASIAAASIVAKVYRDALMVRLAAAFPGYGFERHKGYATGEHRAALARLGPCSLHRRSFAPVAQVLDRRQRQPELPLGA